MKHRTPAQKPASGKQWYLYLSFVATGCALVLLYFFFDPAASTFFPQCPFHALTGFDCPGCGSQRALHSLLHGDILEAADHNILLVTAIPFLAAWFYSKVAGAFPAADLPQLRISDQKLVCIVAFSFIIAFGILRNLPYEICRFLAA